MKIKKMMLTGKAKQQAIQELTSVFLNVYPVFKSTGAYLNYVLPAVFALILHLTMIIGAGIITDTQKEQETKEGYWQQVSAVQIIIFRAVVFSVIHLILSC